MGILGVAQLGGAVLCLAATACTPASPPPGLPDDPVTYGARTVQELAPGVFAAVVAPPTPYPFFANAVFIVDAEGVVVVDPGETHATGLGLIRAIRSVTDLPVRAVINTHWHWDHVGANGVLADSFPGVEILGSAATIELFDTETRGQFENEIARLKERNARLLRWRDQGRTDDGTALSAEDRGQIDTVVARDSVRVRELEETRLVTPAVRVDRALDLGGTIRIRVLPVGKAHTAGDLVVHLPDHGIVVMGDLIEYGQPYFGHGDPKATKAVLDRLAELDAHLHLPGHGPVPSDRALLDGQRALLSRVVSFSEAEDPLGALAESDLTEFLSAVPGSNDEEARDWIASLLEAMAAEEGVY